MAKQKLSEKKNENIKIALVHDSLLEDGGAEKVLLRLSDLFPNAEIYTSYVSENCATYQSLKHRIVSKKSIFPIFLRMISFLKPFLFGYWEHLNLDEYDVVISITNAFFSKSVSVPSDALHICYCLTPPRYLFLGEVESRFFNVFPFSSQIRNWLRKKDVSVAQRVDLFIAISQEVKNRIQLFYKRDSNVIYPPVQILPFIAVDREDYYIIASRLARPKNIEIAIQACNVLHKKLFIIGDGPHKKSLEDLAGPSVKFLGKLSDEKKNEIIRQAKGFIFCSENEDFGIAPIEALSLGVPVISYFGGGPKEYVSNMKNGMFFHELNTESLVAAIQKFENATFNSKYCHDSVVKFDEKYFSSSFFKVVNTSS